MAFGRTGMTGFCLLHVAEPPGMELISSRGH